MAIPSIKIDYSQQEWEGTCENGNLKITSSDGGTCYTIQLITLKGFDTVEQACKSGVANVHIIPGSNGPISATITKTIDAQQAIFEGEKSKGTFRFT